MNVHQRSISTCTSHAIFLQHLIHNFYRYIYQGNAINVKRTVFGYARAGMAGMMIEDQVSPKRCGHVAGKSVVPFDEAVQRVKAACDAR